MPNDNSPKSTLPGACLAVIYLCAVSCVGKMIHNDFVFFPELAALAYGLFMRPTGPWAMAPLMVAVTPAVTALWGVSVAGYLPYGVPSAILCIAGSLLIVKAMKSPVFPAVPAGFLPLVFNVTSVHYVVFIAFDTGVLALLSVAYQRWWRAGIGQPEPAVVRTETRTPANAYRKTTRWAAFWSVLAVTYFLAARTGIRLILFPPLIVIAFETLVRAETCPWARRSALLPAICMATAGLGWVSIVLFGTGPLSVLFALGASIVLIRAVGAFMLPALAISVIPQIMLHTDWRYPLAIGTGTVAVVATRSILNVVEQFQARSGGSRAVE